MYPRALALAYMMRAKLCRRSDGHLFLFLRRFVSEDRGGEGLQVEEETIIMRKDRHLCAHVRDTHGGRHTTTRDVTAFGLAAGTQTLPPTTGTGAER